MSSEVFFRRGPNVILRPFKDSDIEASWKMINDPRNTRFLGSRTPKQLADQKKFVESANRPGHIVLALEVSGVYIGTMGLHNIDHVHGHAETGALIGKRSHQGKGYGTEAKLLLLEFAFNVLNLRQIYSEVIDYNGRSLAYAAKSGYREVARLPDYLFSQGKYYDKVILVADRKSWSRVWKKFYKKNKKRIVTGKLPKKAVR